MFINYLPYCLILPNNTQGTILNVSIISVSIVIFSILASFLLSSISSFQTADADSIMIAQHEKDKNSTLKAQAGNSGTIKLKTDIVPDAECGAWPKRACPDNGEMFFKLYFGKTLINTITGSPDIIDLPVSPENYGVYFDRPDTLKPVSGPWTGDPGKWTYNAPVSTSYCEGKISVDETVHCNLVIHYAWIYD